jgi:hypothetical protein
MAAKVYCAHTLHTVIRFLLVSAKFGTCTVVSVNGTLVEDKMRTFMGECAQFSFNKCPIYAHDGTSAKFSTNLQGMDNSAQGSKAHMKDHLDKFLPEWHNVYCT